MTSSQIIACAISWTAAAVAVWTLVSVRRVARDQRHTRSFEVGNGGGEVTVTAPMSDAEYKDLKAFWLETYGKPGTAHPVTESRPADGQAS